VWQGCAGNRAPYADRVRGLTKIKEQENIIINHKPLGQIHLSRQEFCPKKRSHPLSRKEWLFADTIKGGPFTIPDSQRNYIGIH